MKLGVLTVVLAQMELDKAMKYLADSWRTGCGNQEREDFREMRTAIRKFLLKDDRKLEEFKQAVYGNGLEISALSCHGNRPSEQGNCREIPYGIYNTILLAEKLGIDRIVGFSGCPGIVPSRSTRTGLPARGLRISLKF